MQQGELIPAGVFCEYHHVEMSFIRDLHDSGLIGMTIQDGAVFLPAVELPKVEKFIRWHYELSINPEGIEAIAHLLNRVNALQEENRVLRNKLQRYVAGDRGPVEPGVEI